MMGPERRHGSCWDWSRSAQEHLDHVNNLQRFLENLTGSDRLLLAEEEHKVGD
jgi:hypothetical protein